MSREAKLVRNSSILALQHIAINVISIFVIGYIARKLGKQDYGVYSLAFAFPSIYSRISSLGLRPITIREISRDKEHAISYLARMIPARSLLILFMAVLFTVSTFVLRYEYKMIYAIIIAMGSAVCEEFSRIILDIFQAFEEMGKVAFRDISVRIFTAIASIMAILYGGGLYAVCFVYLIGSLLGLLINIVLFSRRFELPKFKFDYRFLFDNIKEGSCFIIIGFISALYLKIDVLLLSKMTDSTSLGIYNASANLFYRVNFMSDAVATAVFPALSSLYWTNRKKANSIFSKSLFTIILISLPVAIGGIILSKQIINIIYGNSYADSSIVFSILMCTVPFMFLSTLLNYSLGAIRKQEFVAKVLTINLIIGAAANTILIYFNGYIGAAYATLLSQLVGFVLFIYGARNDFDFKIGYEKVIFVLLSLGCLSIVAYATIPLGIYISIPLAALAYYICLYISGIIQKQIVPPGDYREQDS